MCLIPAVLTRLPPVSRNGIADNRRELKNPWKRRPKLIYIQASMKKQSVPDLYSVFAKPLQALRSGLVWQ